MASSAGGTSSVAIPSGTVITKTDGTNLDATAITASDTSASSLSNLGSGVVADGAMQWGIPNIGLTFSTPITLNIFVGTAFNGQTLDVRRSVDGVIWTSDGIVAPATCVVASGLCTFQATKASFYATTHTVTATSSTSTSTSGGSGGGDGGDGLGCAVHDCSGGNPAIQNLSFGVSAPIPAPGFIPGVLGTSTPQVSGNVGIGDNGQVKGEATASAHEVSSPSPQPLPSTTQSPFNVKTIAIIVIALLLGFGVFKLLVK